MKVTRVSSLVLAFTFIFFACFLDLPLCPKNPSHYSYAQSSEKVRPLKSDFVAEGGCPITVSNIRTELDMDPFDVPIDARIYIDYQNVGQRPVSAAKFRIRFADDAGKDLGTFQASHGAMVGPGQGASEKWRREKIDPTTTNLKVRVLLVKYTDGEIWQSTKMQAPNNPPEQ